MIASSLLVALALVASAFAQDTSIQQVGAALNASHVIPDVLPANFTPRFPIEVTFVNTTSATAITVTAGMNLTEDQVQTVPTFAILSNNTLIIGKPYLLAIVDPDANPPQFLHFLGADFVSPALTNNSFFVLANKTAALVPYFPPTPPSGIHRYVVAMWLTATPNITVTNSSLLASREGFNLQNFASQVPGLTLLGATYFNVASPNNTNSTNGTGTSTSAAAGGSATAPAGSGSGSGAAPAPSTGAGMKVTVVWSVLGCMLGAALYVMEL